MEVSRMILLPTSASSLPTWPVACGSRGFDGGLANDPLLPFDPSLSASTTLQMSVGRRKSRVLYEIKNATYKSTCKIVGSG